MADMISASEAKNILGCNDATLNNHINNGSIRAQRADGQLQVSREDVYRLSSGSDSDDGTLILASESDDFSIDLGDVIDDSAATMVHGNVDDDDAQITFNDSDGLEMPDLDDEYTQDLSSTGATADLSFTESNTAVVTSVDETMVDETMIDQTAADLQTVDYGDDDDDYDNRGGKRSSNRRSARVSQRSVRSQRVEFEEEPVATIWPVLMGVCMFIMLLTLPYLYMTSWYGSTRELTGEKIPGTTDNILTSIAASLVGYSVEPDKAVFAQTNPGAQWVPMGDADPEGGVWRHEQWLNNAADIDTRLNHFIIIKVDVDKDGKPTTATTGDNQSVPVEEVNVESSEGGQVSQGVYKATIAY